jgi:LacI family transcriptional regulator
VKNQLISVRIQDVALAAGVSVSTVSRVLNGRDDVAAETYQRVQKIIDDLGYSSSLAAKGMRSRRTNVVGVVIFDLSLPFCIEVVRGIDQMVQAQAYDLIIYSSNRANHKGDPSWERKVVAQLNGSIVDGIIFVTPATINLPTNYPLVTIDPSDGGNFPSLISTNRAGAYAAVRYLIELGHRRIGLIGGSPALLSARQRRQGYEEALCQAGLPILAELCVEGDYSRQTALTGARQLLMLSERPTAIMAANDQSAFAVLEVANQLGISVPQALSVIGFDNTPESAYTSPPLTTVDQSIVGMGSRAAELLIQLIEGKEVENHLYELPTRLVVRESCQRLTSNV